MPPGGFFSGTAGQALLRLAAALLLALVAGLIFGKLSAALAVVLAIYLLVQIVNLLRLDRWLRRRRTELPPDMNGPWGEVIATINRIYRRKQFHKARVLRLLREFRRRTAAMPDGAVLLGASNQIIWFNRNAAAWLGLRRKLDFGIRIENLVRDPQFVDYLKEPGNRASVTIHNPAGGGRWLELHLVTTSASEQKLIIVRDVTREVRIESVRRDFVANASHEMRSPLARIRLVLELLRDESLAPDRREELHGELEHEIVEIDDLVGGLLAQSRLDFSALTLRPNDLVGLMSRGLARASLPIEPTVIGQKRPAPCDATLVARALSNLFDNAKKHAGGATDLTVRFEGDRATIEVSDRGPGLSDAEIERMFDPFYGKPNGSAESLGLGLALVKRIAKAHGGDAFARAREGGGSVVGFWLALG